MPMKMRENSLFGILLRNSSWYSFLIGGFIVAVAFSILKTHHAIYSIAIAVPFFGIGAYRAWQETRLPSGRDLDKTATAVRDMAPRQLVEVLSSAYAERGYDVSPFKGKGADLRLVKNDRLWLVSCKRVKAASTGVQPLQDLAAAGEAHEAAYLSCVTLGELSSDADKFARENRIDVVGLNELAGLIGARLG